MAPVTDLISKMRSLDGSLSNREQLVADYILANLDQISFLSQHEIAKSSNVSVATVNRFCLSIGCQGFRDFQIRLAQSVAVSLQYLQQNPRPIIEPSHLVTQVFSTLNDTLSLAQSQIDHADVEKITDVLANAHRIVFFGVGGGSANVAQEGANRFFRLGFPSEAHSDGYYQRMLAATLSEQDALVAISASGQPQELIESAGVAKQYGTTTISLTKIDSALSRSTDFSIALDIPEDQDIYKPTASRLVYLALVDVLATGTARKRPERASESMRRIRTSLIGLSKDSEPKPIGD